MAETNLAPSTCFPYGSLAAVLVTTFALGCVLTHGLLKQSEAPLDQVGETSADLDLVGFGLLGLDGLALIVAMAIQVSFLVERVRPQRPAVPQVTLQTREPEMCDAPARLTLQART